MSESALPPSRNPEALEPLEFTGINWKTSTFLIATLVISLVTVPLWIWKVGLGWLEVGLFLTMFLATGLSITVGYHRLFTHRAFRATWPVRLAVSLFGAAAFQQPALKWCAEHRHHHKHTDEDGDPHDPHNIKHGFFWAHVGWLLVHVDPSLPYDNVPDLRKDPILRFQERHYIPVAIAMGFLLPMALGAAIAPAIGASVLFGVGAGFLFGGCARVVIVHHATFLINSAAHSMGSRPYDGESSSRDNGLLAFFTFGEGYHNFHHAFQTDYRNGVRPWQFDPSKWTIWTLSKLGLARDLRRIPAETIRLARLREKQRRLEKRLASKNSRLAESLEQTLEELQTRVEEMHVRFRQLRSEYKTLAAQRLDEKRERLAELERELRDLRRDLRDQFKAWKAVHRQAWAMA